MDIQAVIRSIEKIAPLKGAASWDNCGVQIVGGRDSIGKVGLMLDPRPEFIAQALEWGADLVVTHHPLSMEPFSLAKADGRFQVASQMIKADAWLYSAHTSLDAQPEGPAGWLGRALSLSSLDYLEITYSSSPLGILFQFEQLSPDLLSLWATYEHILHVESPTPGEVLLITLEKEWPEVRKAIVESMDTPGSTPGFTMLQVEMKPKRMGIGFVGKLPSPMAWDEFSSLLAQHVDRSFWQMCGPQPQTIQRVAYCTGSGGGLLDKAAAQGADIYITGDIKYHQALEAVIPTIDVGHFILEEEMMRRLTRDLSEDPALKNVEMRFFPGREPFELIRPTGRSE